MTSPKQPAITVLLDRWSNGWLEEALRLLGHCTPTRRDLGFPIEVH